MFNLSNKYIKAGNICANSLCLNHLLKEEDNNESFRISMSYAN